MINTPIYCTFIVDLPIISDFQVKRLDSPSAYLEWNMECVNKSADTKYNITYSYSQCDSSSELTHLREDKSQLFASSPSYLHLENDCEYHVTIAVNRGTEIGPPSQTLTVILTNKYPELSVKADAKSTEVILTFRPEIYKSYIIEPFLIYNVEAFLIDDIQTTRIFSYNTKENFAIIPGLLSNHDYHFLVIPCYEIKRFISCKNVPSMPFINVTTEVDPPSQVIAPNYYFKHNHHVIEWKPPIQNDTVEKLELNYDHLTSKEKADLPDYYEVKVQTSDRGDIIVQIIGTKCTTVPPACVTGTNKYSVRAVIIKKDSQRTLRPRPADYAPIVCMEEITSVETIKDREHVPGKWLPAHEVDCLLSLATICKYFAFVVLSVLPIGVFMAKRRYQVMKDIAVELPYALRNIYTQFNQNSEENNSEEANESDSNVICIT